MAETSFVSWLQHGWNAFFNRSPTMERNIGTGYSERPDRHKLQVYNERTIVNGIYNRIAIDVSALNFQHVELDEQDRYVKQLKSGLNYCLTVEANVDETARAFIFDAVISMLDEGFVALVPIDADLDPTKTGSYDIDTLRVGKILEWYPRHVRVEVYNDRRGEKGELVVPKATTAIIENPLYSVMNARNSTLQRLMRKLALLDAIDEQSGAGKLDMIIQLPYIIKTEARRQQAEQRRKDIEMQLAGSKYGIAYTDGTEKITQLNRPLENNLLSQVEYLTKTLYNQLGMAEEVFAGNADERKMLLYNSRIINPIATAFVEEMSRKFLTKTARTRRQSIRCFRDPFRLIPMNDIAQIADTFTRNEILTSNEIRQILGFKPSDDPAADELKNSNLYQPEYDFDGDGVLNEEEAAAAQAAQGSTEDTAAEGSTEVGENEQTEQTDEQEIEESARQWDSFLTAPFSDVLNDPFVKEITGEGSDDQNGT